MARIVSFYDGGLQSSPSKLNTFYVRAVRPLLGGTVGVQPVTNGRCLAKKLKEWGKLRKCQAVEIGKAVQSKTWAFATCQAKFDAKLVKLTAQASAAAIPCRYGVNGDGTVTDYDTGLQWAQKTDDGGVHDKDNIYQWSPTDGPPDGTVFTVFLGTLNNGTSSDGSTTSGCFAGHCDWRLPLVEELQSILLEPHPCGTDPCIDQTVFGPSGDNGGATYWSATTDEGASDDTWGVDFDDGFVGKFVQKSGEGFCRAVRSGL